MSIWDMPPSYIAGNLLGYVIMAAIILYIVYWLLFKRRPKVPQ